MTYGSDRAFPNLYDVTITKSSDSNATKVTDYPALTKALQIFRHRIERVDLDGIKVETDYNEAQKQNFLKGVTRIKSVTLSIWETSNLDVVRAFTAWISSYYNFEGQYFIPGDPTGEIVIKVDNQQLSMKDPNYDSNDIGIKLSGCIPISVSYPPLAWAEKNPYSVKVVFSVNDSSVYSNVPSVAIR